MSPRGKCWLGARPASWLVGFLVLDYRSVVARGRVSRRRRPSFAVKHLGVGGSFPTSRWSIAVAELMIWCLRALEEILVAKGP